MPFSAHTADAEAAKEQGALARHRPFRRIIPEALQHQVRDALSSIGYIMFPLPADIGLGDSAIKPLISFVLGHKKTVQIFNGEPLENGNVDIGDGCR
jgi:hypothetical protein